MFNNNKQQIEALTKAVGYLTRKINALDEVLDLKKYCDYPSSGNGRYYFIDNRCSWAMNEGNVQKDLDETILLLKLLLNHLGLERKRVEEHTELVKKNK